MEVYACPYNDCSGTLNFVTCSTTDMYTLPYDRNAHTEVFVCSACGKRVLRSWSWRSEEQEHQNGKQ